jgi:hypothetical protein
MIVQLTEPYRHGQIRQWHDGQWCDVVFGPDADGVFVLERLDRTRFYARFAGCLSQSAVSL